MKKCLWMMLALSCLISTARADEKIYLDSECILVGNNGIFAKVNGDIMQLAYLAYDEEGLYTQLSFVPDKAAWFCKTCNRHRWAWQDPCPICGQEKPKPYKKD